MRTQIDIRVEEEKVSKAIEDFYRAVVVCNIEPKFIADGLKEKFLKQVKDGKILDSSFKKWIENLYNYHKDKDVVFAEYLTSLL